MTANCPRLLIAAPQGRSGKTTFTLGLCAALRQRGIQVQPFKKGPDYIDPSWLSAAAGRPCRTLDPFFQPSEETLRKAFNRGRMNADLVVIEGNHGLFDSVSNDGQGSSAAVARVLRTPILLVVNAAWMGRSAAAMVQGCQTFEPETPIAAVILNNLGGSRHEAKLRTAIETYCSIPVVGAIPRLESVTIPDRHLGLIPRDEDEALVPAIQACHSCVEQFVDIEAVLKIAFSASPIAESKPQSPDPSPKSAEFQPLMGVIRDQVFTFYYPENLEALERAGARLVFINSLQDTNLPAVDALYIGGGFPEVFLEALGNNHSFRSSMRAAIEVGLPVYAECGGLMYLSKRISWGRRSAEMVGVLPYQVEICDRSQGHGYVLAEVTGENPFFPIGTNLRGHEFHNSRLANWNGIGSTAYRLKRGSGLGNDQDGLVFRNILASYTHLHADGSPGWAPGLVGRARQYAQENRHG